MSASQNTSNLVKINPPIAGEVFPRERLFGILDTLRLAPVIWIEGPAGCGKTSLTSSYLEARALPCLWYQVDPGDADPATFFYYLGLAAKRTAPRKRKPMPLFTPEYVPGINTFTLRFFEELFNRLPSPCAVVFDNFQEVQANSPFHEVIKNGLSTAPEGINVFCVSREAPPPALTRMLTTDRMNILKWDDLRLTRDELAGIVQLKNRTLSKNTISRLQDITDGWIAGLVLILQSAVTREMDEKLIGKMLPEEIADYFGGEIFFQNTPEEQDFLLKTSFLSKITIKMAQALTGLSHSGRILSQLNRSNLFTEKRFHKGLLYQYHPLFREFLQERAQVTYSTETLQDLRRQAAQILEDAHETSDAVTLLKDAQDWDTLAMIILTHAPEMLAQGRNQTLKSWLSYLPEEVMENIPWLYFFQGVCEVPFDPPAGLTIFNRAFELFKQQEDASGCFMVWCGTVDGVTYSMENFSQLDSLVEEMNRLMKKFGGLPSGDIEAHVASRMVKALSLRKLQLVDEIDAWGEKALSAGDAPGMLDVKIQTLFHLAHHQVLGLGNFKKMALSVSQLEELIHSQSTTPFPKICSKLMSAIFYQGTGQHEKCLKAVFDGMELSKSSGVHVMDHMLLGQCISSYQNINDTESAQKYIDRLSLSMDTFKPWDLESYYQMRCRQALIQHNYETATHYGGQALTISADVGSHITEAIVHLLCAHAAHNLGDYKQANEKLAQTFKIDDYIQSQFLKFMALMAEAQFYLDQGKKKAGLQTLRNALELGKDQGQLNIFTDQPATTARLCAIALEENIEVEYVKKIIQTRGLVPDDTVILPENWPFAVKIHTLGRFNLLINDKPLKFSKKVPQKPLALLKVLIAYGGRDVKTETITDTLWPDADGDKAEETLKITLRRLRKLIGIPEAIRRQSGSISLDQRHCWWDVHAFEKYLAKAEEISKKSTDEKELSEAARITQKAIDLYTGPFLSDEPDPAWAIPLRERLRSKFIRGAEHLGRSHEKAEKIEHAVDCYQKCLEADDTIEEFYQRLMICHHNLSQTARILSVYERCRKTLEASAGIRPSPETEEILRSYTKN